MVTLDPALAAYVALTALLVVTPGASTAVVVRHALDGGRSAGLAAASGIATANTAWAIAAGIGITALVTRLPVVFSAIRWAGAAYLACLALGALHRATLGDGRRMALANGGHADLSRSRASLSSPFREGVTVNLLNPPVATFYMVVVPSFLPATAAAGRFVLFAAIHVVMAFVCHSVWASGFDRLRGAWSRPSARRGLEAVTGIALLALAIRMLR